MNPNQLKILVTLAVCAALAVIVGYTLAMGNYILLLYGSMAGIVIFLLVAPGYLPLIALGLVGPFTLPLPFVRDFPFLAFALGVCLVKYMVRRWMLHRTDLSYKLRINPAIGVFFGWVFLRYCIDPVIPNLTGFGENMSGFRAYLSYAISFGLVLSLGLFLRTRDDMLKLIRWMVYFSLFFILLFTPLIFTKSTALASTLSRFGLFVALFDNGWLRFVTLPGFGCILITVGLLPNLLSISRSYRFLMIAIGMLAVILGGNRGSFLMMLLLVLTIAYVRRGVALACLLIVPIAICLVAFRYAGENLRLDQGVGFFRVLSLTSQRVAERSGADLTVLWRRARWERAMMDIRKHPLIGSGYGGLERAWVVGSQADYAAASVEWDVAAGSIHNGYIACTRALGIPGLLLFLVAYLAQVVFSAKKSAQFRNRDPVTRDLHGFVFANLTALTIAIYTGADLNSPSIWFYMTLGALVAQAKKPEVAVIEIPESQEAVLQLSPRETTS